MQALSTITCDLVQKSPPQVVHAVQYDSGTRFVNIAVMENGISWTPPTGAYAMVGVKKPDGTQALYRYLEDGQTDAVTINGNIVTALLVAQVLTAAGRADAAISFLDADNNKLSTLRFILDIQAAPASDDALISSDYYKIPMQQIADATDDANEAAESANTAAAVALAAAERADAAAGVDNAGSHNSIYRGKYLGGSVTDAQYAAIAAGTFEGLYIGDYWTIGGVVYRIAAFDYYLRCGYPAETTTHHVVIVPDSNLYNAKMNDTNTTEGGYVGSAMYKTNLAQAKTTIKAAFNGHVLNHRIYLTNAVTNGKPSAGAWCDSEVDLMNEQMVYGGAIFMPGCDGTTVPTNYRVEKSQLPLFAHRPDLISNRLTFWLRDVVTASNFAYVTNRGHADSSGASNSNGVRPAFCIS